MEFLLVLGMGVLILGVLYVVLTITERRTGYGVGDWPVVEGVIRDVQIYRHERRTPKITALTFTPVVAYTYTVAGEVYTSHRQSFVPDEQASYTDRVQAAAAVAQYQPGSPAPVYYNPHAPQQAVLEKKKPYGYHSELLSGLINVGLGSVLVVLYFLIR